MNRRSLLTSALVVLAGQRLPLPDWIGPAAAEGAKHVWRHGLAKFGELKYPAGFKQFDYVNPNAPRPVQPHRSRSAPSTISIRWLPA